MSILLLVGAGLLLKSFWRLQAVDPGFDVDRLVSLQVWPPKAQYPDPWSIREFYRQVLARVEHAPGVGCLRQRAIGGEPKYLYGSAGGLYPVQVYLHTKPGRIDEVEAGTYYYRPVDHGLVALSPGADLDATVHDRFVNRPIYEQAAFSFYRIANLDAIEPMYGEHAIAFATLEAGAVSQLLRMAAADSRLGLCAIGNLNFAKIRHLFRITRHVLLHSLVVGGVNGDQVSFAPFEESRRVPSSTDAFEDGEL
jgi:SagB-type dehydrogenase family enzyme